MRPIWHRDHRKRLSSVLSLAVFVGMTPTARSQEGDIGSTVGREIQMSRSAMTQQQGQEAGQMPIGMSEAVRLPTPSLQGDFPAELILPPPTEATKRKAEQLIPTTIDPELSLKLVLGRPKVLQLAKTPKRIYTPTEDIIRTEIIDEQSGREIALTGLQTGTTTLIFWFDDESVSGGQVSLAYEVRVYSDPLLAKPIPDLQAELNQTFPNSYVELSEIGDRLIVRGQAPDSIEMAEILRVLMGARGVRPDITPTVTQQAVVEAAYIETRQKVGLYEPVEIARTSILDPTTLAQSGIINQMKVVGEQQVMLKVTVAEVNRSAARSIGLNFGVNNSDGMNVFQSLTGQLTQGGAGGAGGGGNQSGANVLASLDMGQVRLAIEALRRMNLSRTLAEPNLVAMNGQPADFQGGGQFPIPIISAGGVGNNLQGVSFVPFGVQLEFTPFIQDRDVIRLQMRAEVSTRDESLGTNIGGGGGGGSQVAGLNSRNFSTTVQLRSGQTIAVAGLLQTNFGASTDRVPFWGDLPFIGATGGVNRTSSGEQELVILVTPHLVAPVDACHSLPLPGDDVREPTDIEFFIANRLESRRSRDFRASVRTDYARQKRAEHCCAERFIIGQVGPTDRCCPQPTPVPHAAVPVGRPSLVQDYTVEAMGSENQIRPHNQLAPIHVEQIDQIPYSEINQRAPNVQ